MKFSTFAILATGASAAAVSGWASNETDVSYTTEIVTKLTTYCPEATKITHAGKTYTVTEATTLTITDCPCTLTKPVWTSTSAKKTSTEEWKSEATWKAESSTKKTSTEEWKSESTWKAASTWAAETPKTTAAPKTTSVWKAQNATSTSEVAKFTGAANALNAAGAGVVGVAALFAAVL